MVAGSREELSKSASFHLGIMFLVAVAAAVVYANALPADFVYDDRHQLIENPWIRSVRYLPDIFLKDVWAFLGPGYVSEYYRPLMHLIYMAEYHLFGLAPLGYHLVNLLLHAGVTAATFRLALALLLGSVPTNAAAMVGASLGALVFAVHPIHVEAVAWVASLPELTFSLCCLLAFLFRLSRSTAPSAWSRETPSLLLFCIAILAKETGLILPALFAVYDALFRRLSVREWVRTYLPYAAVTVAYGFLRFHALHGLLPRTHAGAPVTGAGTLQLPFLFAGYLRLLVWPTDLNAFRTVAAPPSFPGSAWLTVLSVLACVGLVAVFLRRRDPVASLALAWLALPLLPALIAVMLGHNVLADRYLYLPSVGVALIVALLISRLWERRWLRWVPIGFVAAWISLGAYGTVTRNRVWRNELALWTDTVKKSPHAGVVQDGLGGALLAAGRVDEAMVHFRLAEGLDPKLPNFRLNLGLAYVKKGWIEQALAKFLEALQIWPDYPKAHYSAGLAYAQLGQLDAAIAHLQDAARLWPDRGDAYRELGNVYASRGFVAEAIRSYEAALERGPGDADAHNGLGVVLARLGRPDLALPHFERAAQLRPGDPALRHNLERIRSRLQDQ